mmetsp:Transcript_197/g.743  ORF Transcript_197/g.743 Transcript_197/m.743 type:complete len:286 (+) Transcript_197:4277-5134(+)
MLVQALQTEAPGRVWALSQDAPRQLQGVVEPPGLWQLRAAPRELGCQKPGVEPGVVGHKGGSPRARFHCLVDEGDEVLRDGGEVAAPRRSDDVVRQPRDLPRPVRNRPLRVHQARPPQSGLGSKEGHLHNPVPLRRQARRLQVKEDEVERGGGRVGVRGVGSLGLGALADRRLWPALAVAWFRPRPLRVPARRWLARFRCSGLRHPALRLELPEPVQEAPDVREGALALRGFHAGVPGSLVLQGVPPGSKLCVLSCSRGEVLQLGEQKQMEARVPLALEVAIPVP